MTIITVFKPAFETAAATFPSVAVMRNLIAQVYISGTINGPDNLPGIDLPQREPLLDSRETILDSVRRVRLGRLAI